MVDEFAMVEQKFAGPRTSRVVARLKLWTSMEIATCPGVEPAIGYAQGAPPRRRATGEEERRQRDQFQTRWIGVISYGRNEREQRAIGNASYDRSKREQRASEPHDQRAGGDHDGLARRLWSWLQQRSR